MVGRAVMVVMSLHCHMTVPLPCSQNGSNTGQFGHFGHQEMYRIICTVSIYRQMEKNWHLTDDYRSDNPDSTWYHPWRYHYRLHGSEVHDTVTALMPYSIKQTCFYVVFDLDDHLLLEIYLTPYQYSFAHHPCLNNCCCSFTHNSWV